MTTAQVLHVRVAGTRPLRLRPRRQPAVLDAATSGLFWIAVLFVSLLAVQRATGIETTDGARRALLLAGVEPAAVFLGKALAVMAQLLFVELWLVGGVIVLYDARIKNRSRCWRPPAWSRPLASPPPVRCSARWSPVSGRGRRCCRSSCSRSWPRC
ncbi:MAG: heme exporter protein CcmB [Acidimicrobiales bacterium]